ncbi:beta-lactamase family protein [Jannaschia sp. S6380]|uniref:serine hydrolase domain-containing protein n=1 Tax=Jannaschia sp. S6380 TaxID=2926408 RepID=UPI001FF247C6|nr:serine hydrolase domain-containing protein [Jannaschia sp. S6380]MCK0167959.1 beta-lactamase family protein [Jannaschia sp. S6380]
MTVLSARLSGDVLTADPAPALPWWSFSKTAIAALICDAAARGELDPDARCPGRAWTLRDLLGHRAGLGDYGHLPAYKSAVVAGGPAWTADDFLQAVSIDRPDTPPRTRFAYSNIGYLLARQALEAATGRGLAELVTTRLAEPLGIRSVRLATDAADFARLPFPAGGYHPGWVAHGCLMGTPGDAVRLLAAILDWPACAAMRDAQPLAAEVEGRPWTETGYGLGLMIGRMGAVGSALGHSGGGAFSACAIYAFPDLPGAPIVASFVPRGDAAPAERDAVARAQTG